MRVGNMDKYWTHFHVNIILFKSERAQYCVITFILCYRWSIWLYVDFQWVHVTNAQILTLTFGSITWWVELEIMNLKASSSSSHLTSIFFPCFFLQIRISCLVQPATVWPAQVMPGVIIQFFLLSLHTLLNTHSSPLQFKLFLAKYQEYQPCTFLYE